MLEVLKKLNQDHPMDIVSTFMGAHAIPEEYKDRGDAFIDMVCEEMLPYVKERGLADYADVFTEDSVFNYEQSKKYLEKAKELGFGLKIHADEIEAIGGSVLAGEMGAASCEHLIAINDEGLASMAKGGVTAHVPAPATSFYLGAEFAPGPQNDRAGYSCSDGFGLNPGSAVAESAVRHESGVHQVQDAAGGGAHRCHHQSGLCHRQRGSGGNAGSGKQGDLVIWDAPDMDMLCYRFGSNLALQVIKKGMLV